MLNAQQQWQRLQSDALRAFDKITIRGTGHIRVEASLEQSLSRLRVADLEVRIVRRLNHTTGFYDFYARFSVYDDGQAHWINGEDLGEAAFARLQALVDAYATACTQEEMRLAEVAERQFGKRQKALGKLRDIGHQEVEC